ncbi:MAG: histidinol-phosphate transaminase [Gemmatimonadaceae bacterium]
MRTPSAEHGGRLASSRNDITTETLVDFSVCLNAYGPAAIVREAIRNSSITDYPDRYSRAPRHAASYRWERPVNEIVFGAGAAELIQAVCFAYVNRCDNVVVSQPCFGEYARAAALCGAVVHNAVGALGRDESTLWDSIMIVIREMQRTNARMVFLASPTSPAGAQHERGMLQLLADTCARCDCLLVLDQSYDAFTACPTGTPALPGHSHVVHLRSLTKDHALAGVRVAFAVTTPAIAECIERARVPWAASSAAQAAAVAAMSDEALAHVTHTTQRLRADAETLVAHCALRGFPAVSSDTHYLLIENGSAPQIREQLLRDYGLLVRDCASFGLAEHIRVAVRTPSENALLMKALAHCTHRQANRSPTHQSPEQGCQ